MLQSEREEQLAGAELQSRSRAVTAFKWSCFNALVGKAGWRVWCGQDVLPIRRNREIVSIVPATGSFVYRWNC